MRAPRINPTTRTTATTPDGKTVPVSITHCGRSPIQWGAVRLDGGVNPLDADGVDPKTGCRVEIPALS